MTEHPRRLYQRGILREPQYRTVAPGRARRQSWSGDLVTDALVRIDCKCGHRRVDRWFRVYDYWAGEFGGELDHDFVRLPTITITCPNPRCGRTVRVKPERLERALDGARAYGRKVLVLGIDL